MPTEALDRNVYPVHVEPILRDINRYSRSLQQYIQEIQKSCPSELHALVRSNILREYPGDRNAYAQRHIVYHRGQYVHGKTRYPFDLEFHPDGAFGFLMTLNDDMYASRALCDMDVILPDTRFVRANTDGEEISMPQYESDVIIKQLQVVRHTQGSHVDRPFPDILWQDILVKLAMRWAASIGQKCIHILPTDFNCWYCGLNDDKKRQFAKNYDVPVQKFGFTRNTPDDLWTCKLPHLQKTIYASQ